MFPIASLLTTEIQSSNSLANMSNQMQTDSALTTESKKDCIFDKKAPLKMPLETKRTIKLRNSEKSEQFL